jgi:hypothetical protein
MQMDLAQLSRPLPFHFMSKPRAAVELPQGRGNKGAAMGRGRGLATVAWNA